MQIKRLTAVLIVALMAGACDGAVGHPGYQEGQVEGYLSTQGHIVDYITYIATNEGAVCPAAKYYIVYRSQKGIGVACINPETRQVLIQIPGAS